MENSRKLGVLSKYPSAKDSSVNSLKWSNYIRLPKGTLLLILLSVFLFQQSAKAQFLMEMIDTSKNMGKNMFSIYQKFQNFSVTGYIQPQYQINESKGAKSFNGGDFSTYSDNRFMLRRGRIRFDYSRFTEKGLPKVHFVFQFDGTDRGVLARDFWGRIFDTKYNLFILSAGIMPRPFGFEVNLGSADRETPERGRITQQLMKTERDLGAMISFEPRGYSSKIKHIKWDIGVYNGQGLPGNAEYDSYKDLISRLALRSFPLGKNLTFSMALNGMLGGLASGASVRQIMNGSRFVTDSSANFQGRKMNRQYAAIDAQIKLKTSLGTSELRGEYWIGTNPGLKNTNEPPATLSSEPVYQRNFTGLIAYCLQDLGSKRHQLVLKYDEFDPNTAVAGKEVGAVGSNTSWTDLKYQTFSLGYNYYFSDNLKCMFFYDWVTNEQSSISAFQKDARDNQFTTRIQFRF